MFLATQYYRAPFPNRRFWADDLSRMRDAGLDALQLWCLWGWIESEPGVYNYDDYDELIALAEQRGLGVVLSTIAEIHPFWIHRLVPDSPMVDHMGHEVISTLRGETNVGLTPGGCTDNPRVAELMRSFLVNIASRYAGNQALLGWDAWNETRWCVHADGHVCYCPHTLRAFRDWLDRRHGGLDGLNAAWQRRYCSWDDVMPGKLPNRPYTEMMEFTRFLTARAAEHAHFRYQALREGDGHHVITAHCGSPAIDSAGGRTEQALCRGNDWELADQLDGFGCSHFPMWFGMDEATLGIRLETGRSVNQPDKTLWVSELQGGAANNKIGVFPSVDPASQQRWIHAAMARQAKGVIFWCWRDEVFGRESSGFGLDGWDGLAEERLAAMARTGAWIDKYEGLIDGYRCDEARVGVLFCPDNYHLKYAEDGNAGVAADAINGCAYALERMKVPYQIVESGHLDALDRLDVLLMPFCLVLPEEARKAIVKFIRAGGRVYCEAETDAFTDLGFYRYPDERPFLQAIGTSDLGRRQLGNDPTLLAELPGADATLTLETLATPLEAPGKTQVLACNADGEAMLVRRTLGKGAAWVLGSFAARPYRQQRNAGFESLLGAILDDAGWGPDFCIESEDKTDELYWRSGRSGKAQLLWLINAGPEIAVTVTDPSRRFGKKTRAQELVSGRTVGLPRGGANRIAAVTVPAEATAVLRW